MNNRSIMVSALLMLVIAVATAGTASAAEFVSVVRDLPDTPVSPGEAITVRLTQEGFFANVVEVTEVLPAGFVYISGSYTGTRGDTPPVYYPGNNTLVMYLAGDDEITESYTVTAGTFEQIDNAVFTGEYFGFVGAELKTGDVTGNSALKAVEQQTDDGSDDEDIPIPAPSPTPTQTATEVIETPTPVETETATSVKTPSADETPTATETAIETATAPAAAKTPKQPKGGIPGFEGVFAIAGLTALVLIMRRSRNS